MVRESVDITLDVRHVVVLPPPKLFWADFAKVKFCRVPRVTCVGVVASVLKSQDALERMDKAVLMAQSKYHVGELSCVYA